MDLLRRELAPIGAEVWEEIEAQAREVFLNTLTARQVVDVNGPHGFAYNALPLGRLKSLAGGEGGVKYGLYQVTPLLEARVDFVLNRWELENLTRGAKDIDLDSVVEAAQKMAQFEESLVYNGLSSAEVFGLLTCHSGKSEVAMPTEAAAFIECLANDVQTLRARGISGPYNLVVNPKKWQALAASVKGYPLVKMISTLITGKIVMSPAVPGMVVMSDRGGDFEMTLGQGLSVGYESHDKENITFFITQSLTFRVLDPLALIVYAK